MNTRTQIYQELYDKYKSEERSIKQLLTKVAWLRVVFFTAAIVLPYYLLPYSVLFSVLGSLGAVVIFFSLIAYSQRQHRLRRIARNLKTINQNEIVALSGVTEIFDDGSDFVDHSHDYATDLDLFGQGSIFQMINRTSSLLGRKRLSKMLRNNSPQKDDILKRQEAIKELSEKLDWRQYFLALGQLYEEEAKDQKRIETWSSEEVSFFQGNLFRIVLVVLPALTMAALFAFILGYITYGVFMLFVFAQWGMFAANAKKMIGLYRKFGKRTALLRKYRDLFQSISSESFNSELLKSYQQQLNRNGDAFLLIGKLEKVISALDSSKSALIGLVLNSLLLWDLFYAVRLIAWHNKHRHQLKEWFDLIGEWGALISLSNYAYNRPSYSYPVISDDEVLKAKGLGHPLISEEKCVVNDFELHDRGNINIITGANMAGKSTFLRTVGVNMVIGRCGGPVFAKEMKFAPIPIFTNMRTTDSLVNDESYFFAELKRLKALLTRLEENKKLFVILDEILRGTNSIDKLNGSREFVRKMLGMGAVGMVATHDLKLAELEQEYPDRISNQCFEVTLNEDSLSFSYKLTNGVTQTMNATFLMEKMGIIESKSEVKV
ncbi:hypothetical protein EYV94_26775 [Puteibacter caeruleilacunae]|nr:hypothetical protein EYV94_26775 [Puteibacter caeruleilacunae]